MNKTAKWVSGIILALILLIFITWQLFKNLKIEKYLENKAKTELNRLWPNRVQFDYDNLRFNFFNKTASLSEISLLIYEENGKDTLASLNINKLSAHWGSYKDFLTDDTIKIKTINFDRVISNLPFDFEKLKPRKTGTSKEATKMKLLIKDIQFINSEMSFYEQKTDQKGQLFTQYELSVKDIFYNSDKKFEPLEGGVAELILSLDSTDYFLSDGFHRLKIAQMHFYPLSGELNVKDILFQPIYDWAKFAELKETLANHITFETDSLNITGIKFDLEKKFITEEITVYQPKLTVKRDKNYILPDDKFVPIFVDKIEEMELPIFVRIVNVEDMYLEYFEKTEGNQEMGKLYFTELNGKIKYITNIADSVANLDASLEINASAKMFGQGLLKAEIIYGLQTKNGDFTARGSLKAMELNAFNEFLDDIYPVQIRSGTADVVYFNFGGTRVQSSGEMRFKYTGLKVDIDTKEKVNNFQDNALSFFANIALAQNNPRTNGKFRVGKIDFKRDTRKSMFNYWSASVVSGFKSTLGASPPAAIEQGNIETDDKNFWQKMGFGKNID